MSDAMPYLGLRDASGTLWLSLPDGSVDDYAVKAPLALPAALTRTSISVVRRAGARVESADPLLVAERSFPLECIGADGQGAEDSLAALRVKLASSTCKLVWCAALGRTEIWTTVRDFHVSEAEVKPLRRENGPKAQLRVQVTLWTDGPWTATYGTALSGSVAATPGHLDVSGVEGDIPALLDMTVLTTDARAALGVGVYVDPTTDYDYVDDYSGEVDAACFGGAKSAEYSLPTAFHASELIATAPTHDVAGNAGEHFALARVINDAVSASSTLYRVLSTVIGSGALADAVSVPCLPSMAGAVGAFELVNLGAITIPSSGMPDDDDSEWATPVEVVTETSYTDSTPFNEGASDYDPVSLTEGHRLHSVTVKTAPAGHYPDTATGIGISLRDAEGGTVLASGTLLNGAALSASTEYTVTMSTSAPILATGTYYLEVWVIGGDASLVTSSHMVHPVTGLPIYSFYKRVYTQTRLGFTDATGVQGMCSESGKKSRIDVLTRLPFGCFAMLFWKAFAANTGVRIISHANRPFDAWLCDSSGERGHSLKGDAVIRGIPGLWPGTDRLVFAGDHPGALTVSGTYWPRYSDAAAGEV